MLFTSTVLINLLVLIMKRNFTIFLGLINCTLCMKLKNVAHFYFNAL